MTTFQRAKRAYIDALMSRFALSLFKWGEQSFQDENLLGLAKLQVEDPSCPLYKEALNFLEVAKREYGTLSC